MKKEFYGFYEPITDEIDKSWNEGIFVFDANTLLNLYRYSEPTRKDFLMVLTKLKEKLYMPYQVGHEYHSNRHTVIEAQDKCYNTLISTVKETCDKTITSTLNQYTRHSSIEVESLKKTLDEFLKKLDAELEKQKKKHPDFKINDEVLIQLTELYEDKVGAQFSKDELNKIYTEGKERYDQQIPPGYKDLDTKGKKGNQHIYGDLIIWKDIISKAKKEKKEIIFITDDRKEDWWTIENGKTVRPREELIKEFYDLTSTRILIYNADNFLHFAKERKLVTNIKDNSITEVKEVRAADEDYIKMRDYVNDTNQWINPTSSIAELLKNYNSINPWSNSTSDIAKILSSEALKSMSQWNNANSNIANTFKSVNDWNKKFGEITKTTNSLGVATGKITKLSNNSIKNNIDYRSDSQDTSPIKTKKTSKAIIKKPEANLKEDTNSKEGDQ